MSGPIPHFRIPLNIPHAETIASRIVYHLNCSSAPTRAMELAHRLQSILLPHYLSGENPAPPESEQVVRDGADLARAIVVEIETFKLGSDRLGQAIRNLFECLGMGEEGARISLRAGENPQSVLRPI